MSILCYHSIRDDWHSNLAVSPALFEQHCVWLNRHRKVVRLEDGLRRMVDFRLPRGDVSITFDDGFDDLYEIALPILIRHQVPATVFVVAEHVAPPDRPVDWIDDPPSFPLRTLSRSQILEMENAGISFGSHGLDHRDMTLLSDEQCERELKASRELLEEILDAPVRWLAYPRGRHSDRVRTAAHRAGYTHAFAMHEAGQPTGRFAIPRAGVFRNNQLLVLRAKTSRWYLKVRRDPRLAAAVDRVRSRGGRSALQTRE